MSKVKRDQLVSLIEHARCLNEVVKTCLGDKFISTKFGKQNHKNMTEITADCDKLISDISNSLEL